MLPIAAQEKIAAEDAVFDISQAKVTTNIKSSKDQRTKDKGLANIIDKDPSSYYWTGAQVRKGHFIRFQFKHPIPIGKTLKIYTGMAIKNNENGDMLNNADLQSSRDGGKSWQTISTFHAGNAEVKTTHHTGHYRILITKSSARWGAIRHLSISDRALTQKTVRGTAKFGSKTYSLSVTTDLDGFPGADDPELAKSFAAMAKLYFESWPKIVKWLGADPDKTHRDIIISFVSTLTHPAHAGGRTMTMNTKHLLGQPHDIQGVFIHELSHIIQAYKGNSPSWFTEGSADYIRYRYYPDRRWANSARARMNNEQPLGLYWNSACFLLWMEDTYQKPITATISKAIVERKYNNALYKEMTGKTLDELVIEYKKSQYRPQLHSPNLKPQK